MVISKAQYEEYTRLRQARDSGQMLTLDGLRLICAALDNDPTLIGQHFLEILQKNNMLEHKTRLYLKKILGKKERKTEIVFSEYFSEKGFRQLTKAMRKSTITAVEAAELIIQLVKEAGFTLIPMRHKEKEIL